jgi:hypothetical protein
MFSMTSGTLVKTSSSFSIVSAFEKYKWIFLGGNLIYLMLTILTFVPSLANCGRLVLCVVLALMAFSYQRRWYFDVSRKRVTLFHGFKLGKKTLYTLAQQEFDYSIIKYIELKEVHHCKQVILHIKDSDETQSLEPISILLKVQAKNLAAVVHQLREQMMMHGINLVGKFDTVNSKDWPAFSSVPLDQDTVKAFVGLKVFNEPTKLQFPVTLFMLPLPRQYFHHVWASSYIGSVVALFILYSSQNVIAAIVVTIFGLTISALRRKHIGDKHYSDLTSLTNEIVISKDKLAIPAIYFEDKQVRQIEKAAIVRINIEWNWYKAGDGDATLRGYRRPFVFRVSIDVSNGESIVLAGQTFDSNRFVIALCQLGYDATLTQIPKITAVWRFYILIPMAIALLGTTGFGLYSLYIRYLV